MKILLGELIGVFESQSGYKVTVVHVIGEQRIVWSGPKVIVIPRNALPQGKGGRSESEELRG